MSKLSYIAQSLRCCGKRQLKRAERIALPFLFLLITNSLYSQYFNLRIDFMGYDYAEVGFALEQMDDGNYIIFHGARPETGQVKNARE